MRVDLDQRMKVPDWIVQTNLRPDILIISEKTKQMGAIELTVPSEERVEVSGELKRAKYEILVEEGKRKGWKVRVWAVEVGVRGFPAASMSTMLRDMGYQGKNRTKKLRQIGDVAERASNSIWKWSHFKDWGRQG